MFIPFLRAVTLCLVVVLLMPTYLAAQIPDAAVDLAARVNHERIARGLAPYAMNAQLTAAAQAHADDLARTGKYRTPEEGHVGSDGSSVFDRVARTGYGAYSWGRRLGENWAHYADTARAFSEWMDSAPHRNNILHPLYREIGIGVAKVADGGYIYIIDFGAQPNVLPFFINDISTETRTTDVVLTLGDEQVSPNGDGASNIGHPIEIQISDAADFAVSKWQPYAARVNWTLPSSAGTKTVYVKYRDAKGRTATARDSIILNIPVTPSPSPTRTLTRTPRPTMTTSPLPTGTPTDLPTEVPPTIPILTATPTIVTATPTATTSPTLTPVAMAASAFDGSFVMSALGFAVIIVILFAVLKGNGN